MATHINMNVVGAVVGYSFCSKRLFVQALTAADAEEISMLTTGDWLISETYCFNLLFGIANPAESNKGN
jgi:hypothetical protein